MASMDGKRVDEPGGGRFEVFPLSTEPDDLDRLLRDLFVDHWNGIRFGYWARGALLEMAPPGPPRQVQRRFGFLTVEYGPACHLHLCIEPGNESPHRPAGPALAAERRVARAELYRRLGPDGPVSWGVRFFNGAGELQLAVFLPNPFLGGSGERLGPPRWAKLELWDGLRARHLGLGPDATDRSASAFAAR
jgi:hypothetical protein